MVEIYQEPELATMAGNEKDIKEWKKLVKSLDLEGQQQLSKDGGSPSVYMSMNNSMLNMFKVLCPKQVDYKSFKHGTIPIEVLKEISLSVHEKYFDYIKIWHDDIDPDPVAIGTKDGQSFLIARWGDEVIPLEELMVKAKNRLLSRVNDQIDVMKNTAESKVDEYLSGRNVYLSVDFGRNNF